MEIPCPNCEAVFDNIDELYNHALIEHSTTNLANILGGDMRRPLTKTDFVQVDSHWIYAVNGFHLSLAPNDAGDFKLMVYGSLENIPPATQYPTEPEWDTALAIANKFMDAYSLANRRNR